MYWPMATLRDYLGTKNKKIRAERRLQFATDQSFDLDLRS